MTDAEEQRRRRAEMRRSQPMVFERITSRDEEATLHDDDSPEERLAALARVSRRAWLASGRAWPEVARSEMPGEVFEIEHGRARQPP